MTHIETKIWDRVHESVYRFYTFTGTKALYIGPTSVLSIPKDHQSKEYVEGRALKIEALQKEMIGASEEKQIALQGKIDALKGRLKKTADIGIAIEKAVQDYLETGKMNNNPVCAKAFAAYLVFEKEHNIQVVSRKRVLKSEKYGYAGETDLIGMVDGKLSVMDIKSGWPNVCYQWQIAAYCQALMEEDKLQEFPQIVTLQLPRQDAGKPKVLIVAHPQWCLRRFLESLQVFKGLNFNKFLKKWHEEGKFPWLFEDALEMYYTDQARLDWEAKHWNEPSELEKTGVDMFAEKFS